MNKIILFSIITLSVLLSGCTNNDNSGNGTITPNPPLTGDTKILVAYFSWSAAQNTETMADYVVEATGGEKYRLYPQDPYTTNYNDVIQIAQQEKNDNARPVLAENLTAEEFQKYDVIFIGYPIWWYDAPMIIYTFLESHDFTGKTIVPFATSGGSGIQEESKFRQITNATVCEGLCIANFSAGSNSKNRVEEWVEELGYTKQTFESAENVEIKMAFNNQEIIVKLVDNSATRDLVQRLSQADMVLTFDDFAGSEKIAYPSPALDLYDNEGADPEVGDLMIYKPWNNLCAFYQDSAGYSESLVLVGHIQNNGIQLLAAQNQSFVVTISLN